MLRPPADRVKRVISNLIWASLFYLCDAPSMAWMRGCEYWCTGVGALLLLRVVWFFCNGLGYSRPQHRQQRISLIEKTQVQGTLRALAGVPLLGLELNIFVLQHMICTIIQYYYLPGVRIDCIWIVRASVVARNMVPWISIFGASSVNYYNFFQRNTVPGTCTVGASSVLSWC